MAYKLWLGSIIEPFLEDVTVGCMQCELWYDALSSFRSTFRGHGALDWVGAVPYVC